uniref:SFRICE_017123 n=1 Tax=Spodoptera frugiperda TaxID=7108 RepID=A0A2H1W4K1_SPOFR
MDDFPPQKRGAFNQRCAMLGCCGSIWLPPIIFIGTHSLALVETDSSKLCFYMERCVLWMDRGKSGSNSKI